jgi:radical SAM superfamily enzyme YgiQ (UPF0313 family)
MKIDGLAGKLGNEYEDQKETIRLAKRKAAMRKGYISVAAIIRHEGPYLREWLEFHQLVGIE